MGDNFKDTFLAQEPCGLSFDQLRALSDEQLIVHVKNRHGDALGILFDRYHRLILHVALKVLRDVGEAEDVMQGVFMEIYKLAVQFDPSRGTAKMWILRHAYHRSINRRRHLFVRNFYTTTDLSGVENALPAPGTDLVAFHEAKEVVDQGLLTLTPMQRRVLQMAYFESLTMKGQTSYHTVHSVFPEYCEDRMSLKMKTFQVIEIGSAP